MNVLMLSPGFPAEMPLFTRGLRSVGANVIGLGDQPPSGLPGPARDSLAAYIQMSLADEQAVVARVRELDVPIDRVECLWEPGMILAARLREALGVTGMTVAETIPFRDKSAMKQVLDAAGIRTPRHRRVSSVAGAREAAGEIDYPLIIKPIAGAGSMDTYRVDDADALETVLGRLGHVPEVSVEEFVRGTEHTFDTICIDGEIVYFNMATYRPEVLIARSNEWVSPQTVSHRDVDDPHLAPGRELGRAVLTALGFQTGFTHMEWFRTPDGKAIFGEIAARPPGARSVDIMNYASDLDLFTGWAEVVVHGRFSQAIERRYNAAVIFKRAEGQGQIQRVEGLEALLYHWGAYVVDVDLLPLGASRRNWKHTLLSDGSLVVRHPDLQATLELADRVSTELRLYAG